MATLNTVTPCSPLQVVSLASSGKCMAEYIWIGSTGADLKSRTVVLEQKPNSCDELPIAEIDGSTYGQAAEEHCEIYLQPRRIYQDPFRGGDHILVLCDIYVPPMACDTADAWEKLQPHASNHRAACEAVMAQAACQQPLFSMQQDYSLHSGGATFEGVCCTSFGLGSAPLPIKGMPAGLSAKASARLGRDVAELHMQACLAAGISYCGGHSSSSSQWAYKVGPCHGIDAADQLCMSRFLLGRVAEFSGAAIVYDSDGDGRSLLSNKCTISFSTATSRDPISGLSEVQCMMERLHTSHLQHALCFSAISSESPTAAAAAAATAAANPGGRAPVAGNGGSGSWHSARDAFGVAAAAAADGSSSPNKGSNSSFSFGSGDASGFSGFTVGVGNKHASIMVPTSTLINRCGPILDRRPPAGSDPYLATMLLATSACGLELPGPQPNAAQLAAALASAAAAAAGSSGAMPIPHAGHSVHCGSGSALSLGDVSSLAPSCSYGSSMLGSSADSRDVLLSELDRLDGYCGGYAAGTAPRGIKRPHCASSGYGCNAPDEVCSDASSPPVMPGHLTGAVDDMFYD